jgi:hypothetical protein
MHPSRWAGAAGGLAHPPVSDSDVGKDFLDRIIRPMLRPLLLKDVNYQSLEG